MSKEKVNAQLLRIGQRLRFLRMQRNETMMEVQKKMAKNYNLSLRQSHYSKIERGLVSIPLITLYALADYFKVDMRTLLDPTMSKQEDSLVVFLEEPELLFLTEELIKTVGTKKAARYLSLFIKLSLQLIQERPNKNKSYNRVFKAAQKPNTLE